jgi:hypothetical protein
MLFLALLITGDGAHQSIKKGRREIAATVTPR